MSEAFVDVTWRGLEVGKRVKLHAVHASDAYLDHSSPMPVGSTLVIKTDEGLEIGVQVRRVHEQVGGSTEVPGMLVVPGAMAGEAAAWWGKRVEATDDAAAVSPSPSTVSVTVPGTVTTAEPVAPPQPPVPSPAALFASNDPWSEITSRPTLTMSAVELERALAAATEPDRDGSRTEVMPAMNPDMLDGVVETTASDDGLVDDGRRTMVMSAVDVSAIVEAAETESSGGVSSGDEDGPSGDGPSASGKPKKKSRRASKRR